MSTKTVIGIALVSCVGATACVQDRIQSGRITVILDPTDSLRVQVEAAQIMAWDTDVTCRLRVREISADDAGSVYTIDIQPVNLIMHPETWDPNSSEYTRSLDRQRAERKLDSLLQRLYGRAPSSHTSFLRPLVTELLIFQSYPDDPRSIHVIGDLIEHDHTLSFLDPGTFSALENDDESIWKSIPGTSELNDLSGVRVVFHYRPSDNRANQRYRVASTYIANRLRPLGAVIEHDGEINRIE